MLNFIKAVLSKDDLMIGLALGAFFSGLWYCAWPRVYPWQEDGE